MADNRHSSPGRRILLVEDERIVALDESRQIRSFGFDVTLAPDAAHAVREVDAAHARGEPFDLVLMDIDLGPGMDGTEAARAILARHTVPIVFLTSHQEQEMVDRVRTITRYGYILKQSGEFVLRSGIEMAFDLFDAHQREERDRIGLDNAFFRQLLDSAPEPVVVADMKAGIVHVNAEFTRLFGYTEPEVRGGNIREIIVPPEYLEESEALKVAVNAGHTVTVETVRCDRNGRRIDVEVIAKPVFFHGGQVAVFGIYRAITERKRLERMERKLLAEQKLLLKEVHHRIRNNLMSVMSLLSLRASSLSDPAAISALDESRGRIESMMMVYDSLYQKGEYRDVDLDVYLSGLVETAARGQSHREEITVHRRLGRVTISSQVAVPIGLMVYELLTNSYKHAFPNGQAGIIALTLEPHAEGFTVEVQDSGVSLPDNSDTGGFGLTLVRTLADQIGATMEVETGSGTRFRFTVPRRADAVQPQSGES